MNYLSVFYVFFFILMFYLRFKIRSNTLKAEKIPGKIVARWTTKYIFYVYLIILFGSFSEYFIIRREINLLISLTGLSLYIIGILGRQWAWRSLGKYWSVNIEIRENHEIIRKGPYKYMRHPNNISNCIEMTGFILIPNSYYALIVFLCTYVPIMVLRSIIEEKIMLKILMEKYINYKNSTWGLIPRFVEKDG